MQPLSATIAFLAYSIARQKNGAVTRLNTIKMMLAKFLLHPEPAFVSSVSSCEPVVRTIRRFAKKTPAHKDLERYYPVFNRVHNKPYPRFEIQLLEQSITISINGSGT